MILMLTDVLLEGTQILYIGDEEIFSHAFNTPLKDHTCFLPGVVSRKSRSIPMLSGALGLRPHLPQAGSNPCASDLKPLPGISPEAACMLCGFTIK